MKRLFLLWLFALPGACIGYAQNYRTESITVADGLSQGFVISLLQDSRGFIWIGTSNGLNRYDGYQIKRFMPDNKAPWTLKASVIYCMVEDADGLIWLGTDKGLVVLDSYTERFVHIVEKNRTFRSSNVWQISIKDGQIGFCDRESGEKSVYIVHPPAALTRLIREGRIQNSDFNLNSVLLPAWAKGPLQWLPTDKGTVIEATDQRGQFCHIDPATLQIYKADLRTLDYRRWGNYGLIYARQGTSGLVFQLPISGDSLLNGGQRLTEFLQPPGEAPLVCWGNDSLLSQLDTFSSSAMSLGQMVSNPLLKPFIKVDQVIAHHGMVDQAGQLWIGTNGYGVRKISRRKLDFRQYLPKESIYNFIQLPDQRIWLGFYQPHQVINLHTGQLEEAPWAASLRKILSANNLLISRSGNWWMAGLKKTQMRLLRKETVGQQWKELPIELKYSNLSPLPMLEDHVGNIWVASVQGEIIRIRPGDNHIDRWQIDNLFPAALASDLRSTSLMEDAHGTIWIGDAYGLVQIEHTEGEPIFKVWHNYTDKGPLFKSDYILSLCPDPTNPQIVWVGTRGGGLSAFNSQTGACETFTEKEGLPDNVVYGILPDIFGNLWVSTNRGLSRFNTRNHTFSNFSSAEPNLNLEFNTGAYRLLASGELAFGSVAGLFLVHPLPERKSEHPCLVKVTQMKINGIVLDPALQNAGLTFTAQNEVMLRLPFDQNNIVLEFAALQIDDPASAQYRYRVLELGEHWIPTGHQRTANLIAIPSGNYTIELQSIDANGNWADAPTTRVHVEIMPPWYRSWPALCLYASLAALLLYLYVWYERRRVRLKYEVSINRKEMERLKSLDEFKNRFFGYISHEFKTPLTIIMGHAKRLPEAKTQEQVGKKAGIILSQGQSMLEMVNQMVDVTKLDNQELQLNWRNGNFSDYVRYLIESLRSLAEFKGLQLHFQSTVPDLMMDFDPLRLKYIINNLLSNAVQHTPSGGSIHVAILPGALNQVQLEVADTGEGIAPEDLPNIFERYYQGSSNNLEPHHFGLGLAFVKDLVQIFAGQIVVSSQPDKGTIFTLSLPITQKAIPLETYFPENAYFQSSLREEAPDDPGKEALPLLLVVEDNPFISNFIQSCLTPYFQLEFTPDGLAGYEKALQIVPDLILTDVMMPYMDGYTLTHQLKNHELTGHIPVVMLSARSGLSDRLAGQQLGADAYIGKPFDEQELVLILQNLHRLQGRWRERYVGLTTQTSSVDDLVKITIEHPDEIVRQTDAFMLKIYTLFEKNYPNDEYDLLHLCHDIEMSKSQLQRKLAALSDQSAMELLRRYRLHKAYEILADNPETNVKEVCFQTGFKDASHFSRLFTKTFQIAPSEVKKAIVG